jgi:hypothetical protein
MKCVAFGCVVFFLLTQSCNNKSSDNSKSEPHTKTTGKESPINCYWFASPNDTIILKVVHVGASITGTLVYMLHEKDKSVGTIQGNMRGDLLVANYTFMSEGARSVRQIAFKKVDNFFIEGYGETITVNNSVIFKNIDSLHFDNHFKLNEINCQ